MLRNNSNAPDVRARVQSVAWHFWQEKSEVRFRTYASALLKNSTFVNLWYLGPKVFQTFRTMFFVTILLQCFYFLQQLTAKNLLPHRYTRCFPVTQFALPLEMKLDTQETTVT